MENVTLTIPKPIYEDMVAHAKEIAPIESCGYLSGQEGVIQTFFKMTNIDHSPEHFTFDPKEQFGALKQARSLGQKLLAVYHSHPASPARLSEEDIRLFNDPEMVYIIVSLMEGTVDVKGFKVKKLEKETLVQSVTLVVQEV